MTHKNVLEALVAILADMPAVGKNQRAPQQMGGYAFRGIDDVLNVLNPLLAKHGVFYAPSVTERIDGQFTNAKGNITWTVKLMVHYIFYCSTAPDSKLIVSVWGEAHDSGDKATQKALTAAQKSMLFQVFAINTADQADSDSERHEAEEAVPERTAYVPVYLSGLTIKTFLDKCAAANLSRADIDSIVKAATSDRTSDPNEVYASELDDLRICFEGATFEEPIASEPKPGKSVPKRPLPQTEGVSDLKVPSEVV